MKIHIIILSVLLLALVGFQLYTIIGQNQRTLQIEERQLEALKLIAQQDKDSKKLLNVMNDFIPKQKIFNKDIRTALDSDKFQSIVEWVSLKLATK